MGRIEEALRKLERERNNTVARRDVRVGSPSARLKSVSLDSITEEVELEKTKLSRWSPVVMLGSDEHAKREYGQIKRPIVSRAIADGARDDPRSNIVVITSAAPGDGKSLTALNLALSLAREKDLSTLLVDGDITKPDLSRMLGLHAAKGLSNLVAEESTQISEVVYRTSVPRLYVMPAGTERSGPAELLGSERMSQIVVRLASDLPRTIVVIDTSPLITSESRILSSLAGQVVLVVRANSTPRLLVTDALEHLDPEKPLGLVLNGTSSPEAAHYGGASSEPEPLDAAESA